MTKLKESTIINTTVDPIVETTSLPVNYPALEYITWFMIDSQNVQNLAGTIFRGGINTNDSALVTLLAATNKAISEVQTDISNIQTFLNQIIPTTKNIDK